MLEGQIEMEKEKVTLMTSQLEEGSKRELAAALEENGHLVTELNKLRNDLQQQVRIIRERQRKRDDGCHKYGCSITMYHLNL